MSEVEVSLCIRSPLKMVNTPNTPALASPPVGSLDGRFPRDASGGAGGLHKVGAFPASLWALFLVLGSSL